MDELIDGWIDGWIILKDDSMTRAFWTGDEEIDYNGESS